jgi:hypothetical protein
MPTDIEEYVRCACSSAEHLICIQGCPEDDEDYAYLLVHLATGGFFERLKTAIKYVAGYKCKYGDFDEILLGPDQRKRIIKVLQNFDKAKEKITNDKNK